MSQKERKDIGYSNLMRMLVSFFSVFAVVMATVIELLYLILGMVLMKYIVLIKKYDKMKEEKE